MSSMNPTELSVTGRVSDPSSPKKSTYARLWGDLIYGSTPIDVTMIRPLERTWHVTGDASSLPVEEVVSPTNVTDPQEKDRDSGLWLLRIPDVRPEDWAHLKTVLKDIEGIGFSIPSASASESAKRSCDIVGSLFLLLVLSPVFFAISILIKLDSHGPVFFRHLRVGKDGKTFVLWKFRSMNIEASMYEVSPKSDVDTRLTRLGRLIRRMSLDELPQLINVLKGEMSLVGPRPEMPFIVREYGPQEYKRLAVKPGMTGLWQISPARAFPIHENLQYDLYYIRHRNILLDCALLIRTILAVIRGVGAI